MYACLLTLFLTLSSVEAITKYLLIDECMDERMHEDQPLLCISYFIHLSQLQFPHL